MDRLRNFLEARREAKGKRKSFQARATFETAREDVDPVIFQYFFDLQATMEKESEDKGMDYKEYARRVWRDIVGDPDNDADLFKHFESSIIYRLHVINMEPINYPHLVENIVELVKKYQSSISHLAVWSKGDVAATGYQLGKIDSSRIVNLYRDSLREAFDTREAGKIMKEKTSYMVLDDKFAGLIQYVGRILEGAPEEKIKLVIIEDSRKNFEVVRKVIEDSFGIGRVEVCPIWAVYSREGQKAKAGSRDEDWQALRRNLNAIDSFADLLDDKFLRIFFRAHVFVDFDGVIGDNIKMREEQAKAIFGPLVQALVLKTGLNQIEILERIKQKISEKRRP